MASLPTVREAWTRLYFHRAIRSAEQAAAALRHELKGATRAEADALHRQIALVEEAREHLRAARDA